jgi:acyl-CoA dehydrogenase
MPVLSFSLLHMTAPTSLSYLRPEVAELKRTLDVFVEKDCVAAEDVVREHMQKRHGADRWNRAAVHPVIEELKAKAKKLGLWNLFIPEHLLPHVPPGGMPPKIPLTHREYAVLSETLGCCPELAPLVTNCSAPDTGNMEVLLKFGTPEQKKRYLLPLLRGEVRSTFLMTEPDTASSDPTNLQTLLRKTVQADGSIGYTLSGRKWWSTGAMDPRCRLALVVARMMADSEAEEDERDAQRHTSHTVVAVALPNPRVRTVRPLTVMGYDDAPQGHAEVELDGVRLTEEDVIAGEGMGFQVAQARLGPGRIHHCMRAIGMGKSRVRFTCVVGWRKPSR